MSLYKAFISYLSSKPATTRGAPSDSITERVIDIGKRDELLQAARDHVQTLYGASVCVDSRDQLIGCAPGTVALLSLGEIVEVWFIGEQECGWVMSNVIVQPVQLGRIVCADIERDTLDQLINTLSDRLKAAKATNDKVERLEKHIVELEESILVAHRLNAVRLEECRQLNAELNAVSRASHDEFAAMQQLRAELAEARKSNLDLNKEIASLREEASYARHAGNMSTRPHVAMAGQLTADVIDSIKNFDRASLISREQRTQMLCEKFNAEEPADESEVPPPWLQLGSGDEQRLVASWNRLRSA